MPSNSSSSEGSPRSSPSQMVDARHNAVTDDDVAGTSSQRQQSPSTLFETEQGAAAASSVAAVVETPPARSSTPPVPDAQIIAMHEAMIDEEEGGAHKKPRGKPDTIEDSDEAPLLLPPDAIEEEGRKFKVHAKKGPEIIDDDDDNGAVFNNYEDLRKKPTAAATPSVPPSAQPQSQPQQLHAPNTTAPPDVPNPSISNQELRNNQTPPSNINGRDNNNVQDHQPHQVVPPVRPTPRSMLPRPSSESESNETQAPSVPMFHEVEATLVVDEEAPPPPTAPAANNDDDPPPPTVYPATIVEDPWWKRKSILIIGIVTVLCVVVAMTIMGTLLASQGNNNDNNENRGDQETNGTEGEDLRKGAEPTKSPTMLSENGTVEEKPPSAQPSNPPSEVSPTEKPTFQPATNPPSSSRPTKKPTFQPTQISLPDPINIKLLPNYGQVWDRMGYAVSVSGNITVVGAHGDDDNGNDSGSAYVYIRDGDTWKQQAKLRPYDGQELEWFGSAVSASGDTIVVGAYGDDDNGNDSGSAYVFIFDDNSWKQQAKLLANDGKAEDRFGIAVSVDGDTIVVGAYADEENGSQNGSAYVFIRDGGSWKQQTKLLPNDQKAGDNFGDAVSIDGDTIVVGAKEDDDNGIYSGSAYVFIREGGSWKQQAKLLPNDGQANDYFGDAVSVDGDTIVVGALYDDDNGSQSGSAYVFIRDGDTWKQQDKLLPNDGQANDQFGNAVSVSGDTIVVGARYDDENGNDSGSAYVFIRDGDTWKQHAKLLPNDVQEGDHFGIAVSVDGGIMVAGASWDDDNGFNSGSAYLFPQLPILSPEGLPPATQSGTQMDGTPMEKPSAFRPSQTPAAKPTGTLTTQPTTFRPNQLPSTKTTISPTEKPTTSRPTKIPTFQPTQALMPGTTNMSSQIKLLPNDGQAWDRFGYAVSVSGNMMVVGAWGDDSSSGSAYVYIRDGDTWKQQAKLLPNDGQAYGRFGYAVSIDGDTIVVGAYYNDDNGSWSGSAYVFIRDGDTWKQQAKLLPNDEQSIDYFDFGTAVSVSSDTIVVGAYFSDENGSNSGSAYVFIRNGESWKQQAKLLPSDGQAWDEFGHAVSVREDTIVVGAYGDDDNGNDSGSAYVFIRDGDSWKQQAKLLANDGQAADYFGIAVSVSANAIVVGAYGDDDNGNDSGSAYVFNRDGDTWKQQAKLLPSDGQANDSFGNAVSVSENTIVVGARYDDDNGIDSGSAYVFNRDVDGWIQQAKLLPSDGQANDSFGIAVSVSGDTIVVGADGDDDNGNGRDSAFVISLQ